MEAKRAILMEASHTEAKEGQLLEEALPDNFPDWDHNSRVGWD